MSVIGGFRPDDYVHILAEGSQVRAQPKNREATYTSVKYRLDFALITARQPGHFRDRQILIARYKHNPGSKLGFNVHFLGILKTKVPGNATAAVNYPSLDHHTNLDRL